MEKTRKEEKQHKMMRQKRANIGTFKEKNQFE
jgi:hypothetical protein